MTIVSCTAPGSRARRPSWASGARARRAATLRPAAMLFRVSKLKELVASGSEARALTTALLQRARNAHATAGLWEAADLQWWWRRPCRSEDVARVFWLDVEGPVATTLLTSWEQDDSWQCDPVLAPGTPAPTLREVWQRTLELASMHATEGFEVPVRNDDAMALELASEAGLVSGPEFFIVWLGKGGRPARHNLSSGFRLMDRTEWSGLPHPLEGRNGAVVKRRLQECSLYDPSLDLSVEDANGEVAGYSLYWFDPATRVGLVEPVRVEDAFQRQGIARAMPCEGVNRLFEKGALRVKVSYSTGEAGALYEVIGFKQASTATWFRSTV